MEVKKAIWEIDVNVMVSRKVDFGEPVTVAEAKRLYGQQDYADVIDEEDHGFEVVGAR